MIDARNFYDKAVKKVREHMITFEIVQLVKEMIYNWMFTRLSLPQKILSDDSCRLM